jgi:hypothetical protein
MAFTYFWTGWQDFESRVVGHNTFTLTYNTFAPFWSYGGFDLDLYGRSISSYILKYYEFFWALHFSTQENNGLVCRNLFIINYPRYKTSPFLYQSQIYRVLNLKSGPYFNISNLFTTCYITQITWIYSNCRKWCPFFSLHLSTRFTMFLLNHFRNSTFHWRIPSKFFNKTLSTVDVRHPS